MTRGRISVAETVPESGSLRANAHLIVTWDESTDPRDVEEAIKQSARSAIRRHRDVVAGRARCSLLDP